MRADISAVVRLAYVLAYKRDSLKRAPGLQQLSRDIAERFEIRAPTIQWNLPHKFSVSFPFMFDPMPSMDRLADVAQAVVDELKQLDSRCQPNSDVFIFFLQYGTDVATWQGGRFRVFPGQPPNPSGPRTTA